MSRLVVTRVLFGLGMLWLVSLMVFFFTQALPGDVARQILGQNATPEQLAQLRLQLGLDHSTLQQYGAWLWELVHGNLGQSLASGTSVWELIRGRIASSIVLVAVTAVITFPLAFFLGTDAARHRGGAVDAVVSAGTLFLLALPGFLIAVLMVVFFSTTLLHVLPPTSVLDPSMSTLAQPRLLVLPVLALTLGCLPYLTQMVRGTMVEALDSEYVTWARLNGVPERRIVWWHALRNVAAPSLQVATSTLIYLVGGIVAVETVFSFPGVGLALVSSVANRDIPVTQAITMLIAAATLLLYVIADIVGIWLTPRVRTSL